MIDNNGSDNNMEIKNEYKQTTRIIKNKNNNKRKRTKTKWRETKDKANKLPLDLVPFLFLPSLSSLSFPSLYHPLPVSPWSIMVRKRHVKIPNDRIHCAKDTTSSILCDILNTTHYNAAHCTIHSTQPTHHISHFALHKTLYIIFYTLNNTKLHTSQDYNIFHITPCPCAPIFSILYIIVHYYIYYTTVFHISRCHRLHTTTHYMHATLLHTTHYNSYREIHTTPYIIQHKIYNTMKYSNNLTIQHH